MQIYFLVSYDVTELEGDRESLISFAGGSKHELEYSSEIAPEQVRFLGSSEDDFASAVRADADARQL